MLEHLVRVRVRVRVRVWVGVRVGVRVRVRASNEHRRDVAGGEDGRAVGRGERGLHLVKG